MSASASLPAPRTHRRILLTGAAGQLGAAMRPLLRANCETLRLSDRAELTSAADAAIGEEYVQVDLADAAQVDAMVAGCDAIVHLGGVSTETAFAPILAANILGVHNLYEACRKHNCRRVIFASSNHTIGYYRTDEKLTPAAVPQPDGMYGVSKAFGENISSFYHNRYGIETACLRIGSCFPPDRIDRRMLSTWLSHADLYRLLVCCLRAEELGHTILYGCSRNSAAWWDNGEAARRIGFEPLDSADAFRDEVVARTPEPDATDAAVIYQGGKFVHMGPF